MCISFSCGVDIHATNLNSWFTLLYRYVALCPLPDGGRPVEPLLPPPPPPLRLPLRRRLPPATSPRWPWPIFCVVSSRHRPPRHDARRPFKPSSMGTVRDPPPPPLRPWTSKPPPRPPSRPWRPGRSHRLVVQLLRRLRRRRRLRRPMTRRTSKPPSRPLKMPPSSPLRRTSFNVC